MPDPAVPQRDPTSADLERYRVRLGFWQAIWGTLISGGVAVAIPAAVDAYKAHQEVRLKQEEIESKAQDFHQTYISKFLDTALNQDIELRLRFSEYFSYVSDKDDMEQWKKYHDDLKERREVIRASINDMEQKAAKLSALPKPTVDDQIELLRLKRELAWNYREVGYARQDSDIAVPSSSSAAPLLDKAAIVAENEQLFRQAIINADRIPELEAKISSIVANRKRYEAIESATGVPWFVVGILHFLDADGSFSVHLNGDPLSARTVHVPAGRPAVGSPPFSWEASVVDTLQFEHIYNSSGDFSSVGGILYVFERYNGFGYRSHDVRSPYVWACTSLYNGGYYISDGTFDQDAQAKYCGASALLKLLIQRGFVRFS